MKNNKSFKQKIFANGSYSVFITIFVVLILIAVNLLVGIVPSKYADFDLSEQKLFSISQQTEKLVKGLKNDITVYYVAQQGQSDDLIEDLISKYKDLSGHIKVKNIDPAVNPTFAAQYSDSGIADNSLVVESKKRFKVIPYDSIYVETEVRDSKNNTYNNQNFEGEQALTSAIAYVNADNFTNIYVLMGHSETALSEDLSNYIKNENFNLSDLSLLNTGAIPEDCGCLIINGPTKDINDNEKNAIGKYLEDGGRLLYVKNYISGHIPNLESIIESYGIGIVDSMVFENNNSYNYAGLPNMVLANFRSHTITDPIINNKVYCMVPNGLRILVDSSNSTYTTTPLLTTSSEGYAKSLNKSITSIDKSDEDDVGAMILAASSENTNQKTRMVVVSSVDFMDDEVNSYISDGNYDFIINSLGWMCDQDSSIAIHSKNLNGQSLNISGMQVTIWSIILMGVIPVLIIAAGIVIFVIRRRK